MGWMGSVHDNQVWSGQQCAHVSVTPKGIHLLQFVLHTQKENALFHEHAYVHASTGSLTPLVNELTDYVRKNHPCHLHHTVLKYTLVRSMLNNYFMNKNWAYPLLYYDVSEVISVITFCGSGKIPNSNGVQI